MTLPPPPPDTPPDQLVGDVPPAVFDLAVNRAAAALRGLPLSAVAEANTAPARALAQWHARTRFARRVPLEAVAEALAQHPIAQQPATQHPTTQQVAAHKQQWHWEGGQAGRWAEGRPRFP